MFCIPKSQIATYIFPFYGIKAQGHCPYRYTQKNKRPFSSISKVPKARRVANSTSHWSEKCLFWYLRGHSIAINVTNFGVPSQRRPLGVSALDLNRMKSGYRCEIRPFRRKRKTVPVLEEALWWVTRDVQKSWQ